MGVVAVSNLLEKPLLTGAEFAEVLGTNASTIRAAYMIGGKLYGRKPPKRKKLGPRSYRYESDVIRKWIADFPDEEVTDESEPEHLAEAREG